MLRNPGLGNVVRTAWLAAAIAGSTLLALACSPEDPQQRAARQAAEKHARGASGYTGEAHCTDSRRSGWFAKRFTEEYVCAARRNDGDCDWLVVRFGDDRRVRVRLEQVRAGCTLPA